MKFSARWIFYSCNKIPYMSKIEGNFQYSTNYGFLLKSLTFDTWHIVHYLRSQKNEGLIQLKSENVWKWILLQAYNRTSCGRSKHRGIFDIFQLQSATHEENCEHLNNLMRAIYSGVFNIYLKMLSFHSKHQKKLNKMFCRSSFDDVLAFEQISHCFKEIWKSFYKIYFSQKSYN